MSRIAMIVDDMFFASKIRGAVSSAGSESVSIKSVEQLEKELSDNPPAMLLIDLNSDRIDPISIVETVKSNPEFRAVPVIAFLSHVQLDLKRRAEEAGCDYVIPRSLFSQMLGQIVTGDLSSLRK